MNKTGDSKRTRDLKWGAKAIGECIGVDVRRAYYLLETGEIPGRKIGGKWVSSETVLLNHIIGYSSDLRIHRDEIRRQSGEKEALETGPPNSTSGSEITARPAMGRDRPSDLGDV